MSEKRAEKFIMAAAANEAEEEGRFIQTPIRFPPALLARIDRAAKKRGLNGVAGFAMPPPRNWILKTYEFESEETGTDR